MRLVSWLLFPLICGCAAHPSRPVVNPAEQAAGVPAPAAPVEPLASRSGARDSTAACTTDLDCAPRQICYEGHCGAVDDLAVCAAATVHFDLDESALRPDDQRALHLNARCLKADPELRYVIQGNCDERGTEEYNLALGDRRANAVARYLESLGAPAKALHSVSFGKERPLCSSHAEPCWFKNRRALVQRDQIQAAR